MNVGDDALAEVAGLLQALPHLHGQARLMGIDTILSRLDVTAPEVAKIAYALLAASDRALDSAQTGALGPYLGAPLTQEARPSTVDLLILTIKNIELQAVLAAFGKKLGSPDSWVAERAVWRTRRGDQRLAIAAVGVDGNAESAIAFGRLYEALRPRAAALVGMAGGVKGAVKTLDVVVADQVFAYDFRKLTPAGEIPRFKTYSPPDSLIRAVELMPTLDRAWYAHLGTEMRTVMRSGDYETAESREPAETWRPRVVRGGVLAGGRLIEDGTLPAFARSIHDQIRAAEMEGAGFAAAAVEAHLPWLVLRGVADIGEDSRPKEWQFAATYAAAAFLRDGAAVGALRLGTDG